METLHFEILVNGEDGVINGDSLKDFEKMFYDFMDQLIDYAEQTDHTVAGGWAILEGEPEDE